MAAMTEGGAGASAIGRAGNALPEELVEEIRRYYGFDKPVHIRYGTWLWNLLHLDLGRSYVYQDPVWDVIKSRFPVSIFLGLTGFFLGYLVCVPLGVLKAVRHGSRFDFVSSVVVFLGYAIPGWALGTALLVLLGGGSFWDVFPLGGFRPDNWEYLSLWGKITGQLEHMALPVLCYMVGGFATLTILTKNSLMENLGQDYVRTAFAKGLSERRVIFVHALAQLADPDRHGTRPRHQPGAGRLVPDRKGVQHRRHGLPGLHGDPAARLPRGPRDSRDQQLADARRQHPLRHHLRVRRPAHPLPMSRSESILRKRIRKFRRLKRGYYAFLIVSCRLRRLVLPAAAREQQSARRQVRGRVLLSRCLVLRRERFRAARRSAKPTIASSTSSSKPTAATTGC